MVDAETEETFSPERHYQMKELPRMSHKMQEAILLGLSQSNCERVTSGLGGFAAVSERFVERCTKALKEFEIGNSTKIW